jgi:iron complex transport system ATP-binding protein
MSLVAERLGVSYGQITALAGLSAAAAPGRITALVGPNAAGKSTLLRCLTGALRPTEGRALLDGEPVHRVPARRLARRIAYVAQRPSVAAAFTVRQVVELGRHALAPSPRRVDEALSRMDLTDVAHRPFPALSAGQQQRASLARAVAQVSADGHLLLDEPTAALDLRHVLETLALLRALADGGATIVVAMHDLALAAALADDCWLLRDGRLEASGPAPAVMDPARLRAVFGVEFRWLDRPGGPPVLHAGP